MDPNDEHGDASPAPGEQSAREPDNEPDPADTLSPAVRRLVRQYDLDITGIHGTGPAGKIRVGDVIGMLGGRTDAAERLPTSERSSEPARSTAPAHDGGQRQAAGIDVDEAENRSRVGGAQPAGEAAEPPYVTPTTTVFECDLGRVLSHRKRERRGEVEPALTSYVVAACADALRAVPEVAAPPHAGAPRLGVLVAAAAGRLYRSLVVAPDAGYGGLPLIDAQLRSAGDDDIASAQLWIHHYGGSGSLLATPTELGPAHTASVGIGRVRREIVVKTVDGEEGPRVAARCYVSLTFRPERLALARANQFLATLVRILEQWPVEPSSA